MTTLHRKDGAEAMTVLLDAGARTDDAGPGRTRSSRSPANSPWAHCTSLTRVV
ncbi:hypothetical protein ACFW3N_14275 [Streptomyces sp. NPDC058834]|uniref:hypothetical protein n=1 Tax=Streptomyces sp. NPDC058834 TaxID=3346647 RepID=UPI0036A5CA8F